MKKTFTFMSFGSKVLGELSVNKYCYGNRLAISLNGNDDGYMVPWASITVNIDDTMPSSDGDYAYAYVDINNFREGVNIIERLGIGENTGIVGFSGFCSYPLYRFDLNKLGEYDSEGVKAFCESLKSA